MNALRFIILVCLLVAGSPAVAVKYGQEYHENLFANHLSQALNSQQLRSNRPLWLTNIQEIVPMMKLELLLNYEKKFLKYGANAGFTNSLLERYILLPPGVKDPHPNYGDIMLVVAKPLKKENSQIERVFVSKANNRFEYGWLDEREFQKSLRDAGIKLSQLATPLPVPSIRFLSDPTGERAAQLRQMDEDLPLWARVQARIGDACERIGVHSYWAPWIQFFIIMFFVALAALLVASLWRRFQGK